MGEGTVRWEMEQVVAAAPRPTVVSAAQPLAVPKRWLVLGTKDRLLWGRCAGSEAEPYSVLVDHTAPAFVCTCLSRVTPCKHAIALLMLWVRGQVPNAAMPVRMRPLLSILPAPAPLPGGIAGDDAAAAGGSPHVLPGLDIGARAVPASPAAPPVDPSASRDERVARMRAGLLDLCQWLEDRVRTGLTDPAVARYATWDQLAARLVDAQVGGLANRVRRVGGLVGAGHDWHQRVAEELGMLWLLANGGLHLGALPGDLADSVAVALGWQVRTATVLAGAPVTDVWHVAGRSDTREDRIEVRRLWLRGQRTGRWAMALSFAAYRQSLDTSLTVGEWVEADLYPYPGRLGLRVLVGPHRQVAQPAGSHAVHAVGVPDAVAFVGDVVAAEPWIEHVAVTVRAWLGRTGSQWMLTDERGALALAHPSDAVRLLAATAGRPADITVEWTPHGVVPLAVHLSDRSVDLGPRADTSFVAAS